MDKKAKANVLAHLTRLRNSQWPEEARKRLRHLRGDIYEVRPKDHRVLVSLGPWEGSILLLRAIKKQRGRTPPADIGVAMRLHKEAEETRKAGGEPWPEIEL